MPTPYGTLQFPVSETNKFPAPEHGLWAEHVKLHACNRVWQVNMLAIAQKQANPLIFAMLPGETLAEPSAQQEAERVGNMSIRKTDESCASEARAFYTRFLGYRQADGTPGKANVQLGWFEEWQFKFCQKDILAQMAFLPRPGGGGYEIKTRLNNAANPGTPAAKPPVP
jgi:hypothetical protein